MVYLKMSSTRFYIFKRIVRVLIIAVNYISAKFSAAGSVSYSQVCSKSFMLNKRYIKNYKASNQNIIFTVPI